MTRTSSPRAQRSGQQRRRLALVGVVTALALLGAACGTGDEPTLTQPTSPGAGATSPDGMDGGGRQMDADAPRVPPVFAYYDGERVFFIHTEVSDPKIADALRSMMGSPVPVVARLAQVPDGVLGDVYVFTNGVKPQDTPLGPLNFQPDVFDSAPGDEDYTPLRRIVEVTWSEGSQARVLKSVDEITRAQAAGELTLKPTDVVVNAPLLTWPGGQR